MDVEFSEDVSVADPFERDGSRDGWQDSLAIMMDGRLFCKTLGQMRAVSTESAILASVADWFAHSWQLEVYSKGFFAAFAAPSRWLVG